MFGLLLTVFFMLSTALLGSAEETLLFLGNEKLRPLLFSKNKEPRGLIVDITRALGEKVGLNIEVKLLDWAQAQEMVQQGKADALLQINRTEKREALYDFSVPLLKSDFTIFRRLDKVDIIDVASLRGRTVGIEMKGLPCSDFRDEPEISLRYIPDWQEGFKLIRSGEIDAIVVDRWIGEYELFLSGFEDIVPVHKPIQTSYTHIAVQKGNHILLDKINRGLTEIRSDGTMDKIIAQWYGKKIIYLSEEKMNFYYIIAALAIINVILLILTIAYARLLMKTKKEAEKLAYTDALTKLLNRRSFYANAERDLDAARRKGDPVSVIQIDVDSFKNVNDSWGHLFGDTVLVAIADTIKKSVLNTDICARMGGDEFTLFLPNSNGKEAAIVAEKIRCAVANLRIKASEQDVKVSISVGVATDEKGELNLEELTFQADEALYRAKKAGRNRIEA